MSSAAHALEEGATATSVGPIKAEPASGAGSASRPLDLWWRYRDGDLAIDQSLYLKLPRAEERLMLRDVDGQLQPLSEDAAPGRDFLVEGRARMELGHLARLVTEWLTLSMRRFYLKAPSGRSLELSEKEVVRPDALIRRLDAFLDEGAGPYRVLAVALRSGGDGEG